MVPVTYYLLLSGILFSIGVLGFLIRRNVLVIFMSIEIMLNAANLAFIAFAREMGSLSGQVIVFLVMTVAAAEAGVGLAIIILFYRNKKSANVDDGNLMKW
jgi:NADH-quinone oxidoreductase subunit K